MDFILPVRQWPAPPGHMLDKRRVVLCDDPGKDKVDAILYPRLFSVAREAETAMLAPLVVPAFR